MGRALLWLLGGLVLFLVAIVATQPGLLGLRALGLTVVTVVPAALVVAIAWDARRRSNVYGGHTPEDPDEDD